jgi:hypothetical protein
LKKLSGTDAEKKSFFDGLSDSEDDDDRHVEKPGTIDLNPHFRQRKTKFRLIIEIKIRSSQKHASRFPSLVLVKPSGANVTARKNATRSVDAEKRTEMHHFL